MLTPITPETRIIYLFTLTLIAVLIGSMQFVTISITTAAQGIIRPAAEVTVIRSPVGGRVIESYAVENAHIRKGSLLYRIDTEQLREQMAALRAKIQLEKFAQSDASRALSASGELPPPAAPSFQTPLYSQSYRTFYQDFIEASTACHKSLTEFNRQKKLFEARVIAASEYEGYQFEWEKAKGRRKQIVETHRNQWELERQKIEASINDGNAQLAALELEEASHTIVAPLSGTLQQRTPLLPGTFVYANQELAQIAPDTNIVVVAYVRPDDIAALEQGSPVRLQVDAYHHHQWGMAKGRVMEISEDSKNINNSWVYEVRCALESDFLLHSSGRHGYLRKGMTLRAHFPKYNQTVWQLIYQKTDDRLNPYSYQR